MGKKGLIYISLLLLAATTLSAQEKPEKYKGVELSLLTGLQSFDSKLDFDDAMAYGVRIGYHLASGFEVELSLYVANTDTPFSDMPFESITFVNPRIINYTVIDPGDIAVDNFNSSLDLLYNFNLGKQWRFMPYAFIGLGNQNIDMNTIAFNDDDFYYEFGGGLRYFFNRYGCVRLDVRSLYGEIAGIANRIEALDHDRNDLLVEGEASVENRS